MTDDRLTIPPERDLPRGRLERRKEHLVAEVASFDRNERRRRRRLALVLVPAAVLLLAATGFTTYALLRGPTHLETIGCYETASTSADTTVVRADGRDPRVICAELWAEGAVGEGPPPKELAACVLETGPVGVFPSRGPDTCERLGLADLPASYGTDPRGPPSGSPSSGEP